jgi:hypothetical protein
MTPPLMFQPRLACSAQIKANIPNIIYKSSPNLFRTKMFSPKIHFLSPKWLIQHFKTENAFPAAFRSPVYRTRPLPSLLRREGDNRLKIIFKLMSRQQ